MNTDTLIADAAVGRDIVDCLVLASHPLERKAPDGQRPSLTRRTIVLRFDGRRLHGATEIPVPLTRAWSSPRGVGYCVGFRDRRCFVVDGSGWRSESFSEQDEDVMRIGGLGGAGSDDVVWISCDGALFLRRNGVWSRHVPPEPARRVFGVGGVHADALYVCTDRGFFLWTPHAGFEPVADKPRGVMKEVLVRDGEIFAGNRQLMRWTRQSGWQACEPVVADVTAIAEIDEIVVVGTFEKGVFEGKGGSFAPVTTPFQCLEVQRVGSGAFAQADGQSYVRSDTGWRALAMPRCAPGQLPEDQV